jgi:hypothetical protein
MGEATASRDSSAAASRTVVMGAVRSTGATTADRRLALQRAQTVAAYLRTRGMVGDIRIVTRPTPVSNVARDRFVEISIVRR